MNYNDFLKMLGNTNPICFIDNDTIIPLKDVPNYIDKLEMSIKVQSKFTPNF